MLSLGAKGFQSRGVESRARGLHGGLITDDAGLHSRE